MKTCRAGPAEVEIRRKFLQGEATALNFFHPNVVRLLGIAVRSHPIMIVMEYVAGKRFRMWMHSAKLITELPSRSLFRKSSTPILISTCIEGPSPGLSGDGINAPHHHMVALIFCWKLFFLQNTRMTQLDFISTTTHFKKCQTSTVV